MATQQLFHLWRSGTVTQMASGGDTDRMTSCNITLTTQNPLLPSNPCKSPSGFRGHHILSSRGAACVLGIMASVAEVLQRSKQTASILFVCFVKDKNSAVHLEGMAFALTEINPLN